MVRRASSLLVPLLLLVVLPVRSAAGAPPSPSSSAARAQKLVQQAAVLEQRGDLNGAQDELAGAAALDPEPSVVLALAKVRVRLGKLVAAREALATVALAPADAGTPARPLAEAQQLFADVGARIPHVRLVVEGAPPGRPAALSIILDEESLADGAERLPIPVDPGHHVFVVRAGDLASGTVAFDAAESTDRVVRVQLRPIVAPRALVAQAIPQPPSVAPAPPAAGPSSGAAAPPLAPSLVAASAATDVVDRRAAARRAKFSVGRFFLESLGSAVVGSLAAYGTFKAACGDQPCLGGSLESLGVNVVVTPLTVWGLGEATGGDGGLGWAFVGGLAAFSGYTTGTTDPTLPLVIGVVLMPFTSALLYEVSSNANAQRVLGPNALVFPSLSPVVGANNAPVGAMGGLGGRF
jgi:hypothetical protein